MQRLLTLAVLTALGSAPCRAAGIADSDLMQAAVELGQRYDANYNAHDAAAMAGLYLPDGTMISPGPVLHGTAELQAYYRSRFAAGAGGHRTQIVEVHAQGDGGYGVGRFAVTLPDAGGGSHELHGNLAIVYRHAADGWHFALLAASVAPAQ